MRVVLRHPAMPSHVVFLVPDFLEVVSSEELPMFFSRTNELPGHVTGYSDIGLDIGNDVMGFSGLTVLR